MRANAGAAGVWIAGCAANSDAADIAPMGRSYEQR